MVWLMFWNISMKYFLFFSIQNIKSNCYIIFLRFFPIIFFWWKTYPFPVIFIYKRFNFCYSLWIFFYFFIILRNCYSVLETFIIFYIDRIYCCFFIFYPVKWIYIWSITTEIYFMTFIIQRSNIIKGKWTNYWYIFWVSQKVIL